MQHYPYPPDTPTTPPPGGPTHIHQDGGYTVVSLANLLVAAIIIVALVVNGGSAIVGIVAGALYYAVTTNTSLLILSGSLSAIVTHRQDQITVRQLHRLQFTVSAPPPRPALPADLTPTPSAPLPALPITANYVPAANPDDSVRREALAFALQLYGPDGQPDAKKVVLTTDKERPGRLRIAVPSKSARQYLLDKYILTDLSNGYRLNIARYPSLDALRADLS